MAHSSDDASAFPVRRAYRTLPSTPGIFLRARLRSAAGHFGPGFGFRGALAFVRQLPNHYLMHQGSVHGRTEDVFAHFDAAYYFTLDVL